MDRKSQTISQHLKHKELVIKVNHLISFLVVDKFRENDKLSRREIPYLTTVFILDLEIPSAHSKPRLLLASARNDKNRAEETNDTIFTNY